MSYSKPQGARDKERQACPLQEETCSLCSYFSVVQLKRGVRRLCQLTGEKLKPSKEAGFEQAQLWA